MLGITTVRWVVEETLVVEDRFNSRERKSLHQDGNITMTLTGVEERGVRIRRGILLEKTKKKRKTMIQSLLNAPIEILTA